VDTFKEAKVKCGGRFVESEILFVDTFKEGQKLSALEVLLKVRFYLWIHSRRCKS
jgi:hypothetical protein